MNKESASLHGKSDGTRVSSRKKVIAKKYADEFGSFRGKPRGHSARGGTARGRGRGRGSRAKRTLPADLGDPSSDSEPEILEISDSPPEREEVSGPAEEPRELIDLVPEIDFIFFLTEAAEGGRLRTRIISRGYNKNAPVEFPRQQQRAGALHRAPLWAVSFVRGDQGNFFYRVIANQVGAVDRIEENGQVKHLLARNKIFRDEGAECEICLEKPQSATLVPCGHSNFCMDCAKLIVNRECPMCRTHFTACVPEDQIFFT